MKLRFVFAIRCYAFSVIKRSSLRANLIHTLPLLWQNTFPTCIHTRRLKKFSSCVRVTEKFVLHSSKRIVLLMLSARLWMTFPVLTARLHSVYYSTVCVWRCLWFHLDLVCLILMTLTDACHEQKSILNSFSSGASFSTSTVDSAVQSNRDMLFSAI